ncbi:MAG TPA: tRNA pseudouridine(55) synthase TruB [Acidimicrobiales bacterium]
MIDGLAVVDKPAGMTSHDVVARCRRLFGQKKVGHAGTLDPDATGVLLVGLGRATRLLQFHSGLTKSYTAEVVLGIATTTLDSAGEITGRWDQRHVTLDEARQAAAELTGTIWQVPPMVSAVKVGGRRLHELARQGLEVDRAARQVTVTRFDLTALVAGAGDDSPVLSVDVECSAGTYVRVLAADLGAALGGGAHLRRLRRTAVGPWAEAMAVALDALGPEAVIAPAASLPWLEAVMVDGQRAVEVANGRVLDRNVLGGVADGPWRVIDCEGALLAVYQSHREGLVKPIVVMPPPS